MAFIFFKILVSGIDEIFIESVGDIDKEFLDLTATNFGVMRRVGLLLFLFKIKEL